MAKTILTTQQSKFLSFVGNMPSLSGSFYLTGGTCLSEYYLQHRFSEDLDFFSEQEFDPTSITLLFKQNKKKLGYATMEFQQSFNRNILKVEFTFYPFVRIESIERKNHLQIDSLKDTCVNKIFTIYQQPRGRDFYDVFVILKKTGWQLQDIIKIARIKFDTPIDLLQLGGNFMKVTDLKDDPLVIDQQYNYKEVEEFFIHLATTLKDKILTH